MSGQKTNIIKTLLQPKRIDRRIASLLAPASIKKMQTIRKPFELHRRADYFRAVEAFIAKRTLKEKLESAHHGLQLQDILRGAIPTHYTRRINLAQMSMVAVDYEKMENFPDDCFWVFVDNDGLAGVVRISNGQKVVELAFEDNRRAAELIEEINQLSVEHSVYRNKFLQVDIQEPMQDDYGYTTQSDGLQIQFRKPPTVSEDQIIFDPAVKKMIDRNVISFFENRERLRDLGLPLQRGVLFYGPPGTGKTFTCQYIYGRLNPVTTITVTGKGLGQVRAICSLARLLHPAILVLEDVDLIFTSREINLYSTSLGDMMDELDAFKKEESVLFILTTNSIDRLEEAIKDRPGRISQCIFFGPPTKDLRKRYLKRYLEKYNTDELSLDTITDLSEGASQAFLEEAVYRAVQIAAEANEGAIKLTDECFQEAIEEMTAHKNQSAGSIVGFQFDK